MCSLYISSAADSQSCLGVSADSTPTSVSVTHFQILPPAMQKNEANSYKSYFFIKRIRRDWVHVALNVTRHARIAMMRIELSDWMCARCSMQGEHLFLLPSLETEKMAAVHIRAYISLLRAVYVASLSPCTLFAVWTPTGPFQSSLHIHSSRSATFRVGQHMGLLCSCVASFFCQCFPIPDHQSPSRKYAVYTE